MLMASVATSCVELCLTQIQELLVQSSGVLLDCLDLVAFDFSRMMECQS